MASRAAAFSALDPEDSAPRLVRAAGRASMRDPEQHWDAVDEASDASFPASDAPSYTVSGIQTDVRVLRSATARFRAWRQAQSKRRNH